MTRLKKSLFRIEKLFLKEVRAKVFTLDTQGPLLKVQIIKEVKKCQKVRK